MVAPGAGGVHTLGCGASYRCLCSGRVWLQTNVVVQPRAVRKARANYGLTGSCRGFAVSVLTCDCIVVPPQPGPALGACDEGWARAIQVHS